MFEIKSIKAVKKDVKKLPADVLIDIKTTHFKNIRENPFQSHELGYALNPGTPYQFSKILPRSKIKPVWCSQITPTIFRKPFENIIFEIHD